MLQCCNYYGPWSRPIARSGRMKERKRQRDQRRSAFTKPKKYFEIAQAGELETERIKALVLEEFGNLSSTA